MPIYHAGIPGRASKKQRFHERDHLRIPEITRHGRAILEDDRKDQKRQRNRRMDMSYSLPLHKMTLAEKIGVMEEIWADLSTVSSEYEPPAWHESILEERKRLADSGEVGFTDWETAKREIRERVS